VIDKVQRLKQANVELAQAKASSEESLMQFFLKLGVDSLDQVMNEIDRFNHVLAGLEQKLRRERSRNRKLAKLQGQIEFEFMEKEAELKTQFATQEGRMQTVSEANEQLTSEIERNRKLIERLNTEIANSMSSHTQAIDEKTREAGESMRGMSEEMQQQRDELMAQVSNRTTEITKLRSDLQQATEERHRWRRSVKQLKKIKDIKESQLQETAAQLASRESELLEKFAREKQALRENYERLLEQLKGKNQAMRKFADSTTSDLADCESRLKELSAENSALVIERNQLGLKVATQQEEMKREKQLLETKAKAVELDLQMQMQVSVEEHKARLVNEKRETFSIVANAFRQFFDPRNQLDTKYLQSIVERASADLTKLQRQDGALRKIVGIGTLDSLEDAITKILLSAYHS
jgi:chromosome segregation ATPase